MLSEYLLQTALWFISAKYFQMVTLVFGFSKRFERCGACGTLSSSTPLSSMLVDKHMASDDFRILRMRDIILLISKQHYRTTRIITIHIVASANIVIIRNIAQPYIAIYPYINNYIVAALICINAFSRKTNTNLPCCILLENSLKTIIMNIIL